MDVLPDRLVLATILAWITPSKGVKIRATHAAVGRSGVLGAVETGSNAVKTAESRLVARSAIVAGIQALVAVTERCDDGASAGKKWVRENRPHFVMTWEQFRTAIPGNSEPRSGWNSARNALSNPSGPDLRSVGIVKLDDGSGVAFLPIK